MADAYKGLHIRFEGDNTNLSKSLSEAQKDARNAEAELKRVNAALKLDPSNVELLAQKEKYTAQEASALRREVDLVNAALKDDAVAKNSLAHDRLERQLVTTTAKLGALTSETRTARQAWTDLSKQLAATGEHMDAVGKHAEAAGMALTRTVTAATAALGIAALKTSSDYETAFAGVRKTVDMTEEEYDSLYKATKELAGTSPVGAETLFEIEMLGGQLGIVRDGVDDAQGALLEFGKIVSGIDIATDLDADEAATELAQFANITGMSTDNLGRFGSTLVALGNTQAATESQIMALAMRLAGAGSSARMTDAQIIALSASMASLGIEAEAGGSAMSTIISEIDKSVALNKENVADWASVCNMSAEEFGAAWSNDVYGTLGLVISGMKDSLDEGGNISVMLDELGIDELRQTDVLKRLANSENGLTYALEIANQAWEENTALQAEVDARNDTTAAKVETLKNKLMNVADTLGGPLCDMLVEAIDAAEPMIQAAADIAKGFADMDESGQRAIVTVAGIAAGLGPILTVCGKAAQGLGAVASAAGQLAGKQAAAAGATATASSAMVGAATSAGALASTAVPLAGAFAAAGAAASGAAVVISELVSSSLYGGAEGMAALDASFQQGAQTIQGFASTAGMTSQEVVAAYSTMDQSMADNIAAINNWAQQFDGASQWVFNLVPGYADGFVAQYQQMFNEIDASTLAGWLAAQATTVAEGGTLSSENAAIVQTICDTYSTLNGFLPDVSMQALQAMASAMSGSIPSLANAANMGAEQIISVMRSVLLDSGAARQVGTDTAAGVAEGMRSEVGDVQAAGQELGQAAESGYKTELDQHSPSRKMYSAGQDTGRGAANGMLSMVGTVSAAGSSLANAASSTANNSGNAWSWGSELGSNFGAGIRSMWGYVASAASSLASAVASYLHFTEPDIGALVGINDSGAEMALNYAASMMSKRGEIARAAASLATAARIDGAETWAPPSYTVANTPAGGRAMAATSAARTSQPDLAAAMAQLAEAINASGNKRLVVKFDPSGMAHAIVEDMDRELRMREQVM